MKEPYFNLRYNYNLFTFSQLLCFAPFTSIRVIVVYLVDGGKNKRRKCLTLTQTSQCSNK